MSVETERLRAREGARRFTKDFVCKCLPSRDFVPFAVNELIE